jgi:protein arginine kinase activator
MRCDNCHEREAVIHLTQLANDQAVQVHLCERCAAEKGVESATALVKSPLGGLLAQLSPAGVLEEGGTELRCPRCGAGLADFREAGRLGCPECWVVFAGPLSDLVRRLHGAARHVGERYAARGIPEEPSAEPSIASERLRQELRDAVAAEDFERAARLRDLLRSQP